MDEREKIVMWLRAEIADMRRYMTGKPEQTMVVFRTRIAELEKTAGLIEGGAHLK